MRLFISTISILFLMIFLFGCSGSQPSQEEDQVYVFDQIPKENTIEAPKTGEYPNLNEAYFVVQIGAFTTKERAESFSETARTKIKNEIDITYNDSIKLFVVQVTPFYKSKKEAELVRDEIRMNPDLSDAWIVTVNK
jgi:cell division septation protein DedD